MTVDCFHWNNDGGFIKRLRVFVGLERDMEEGSEEFEEARNGNEREGERKEVKEMKVEVIKKEETDRQSERRW